MNISTSELILAQSSGKQNAKLKTSRVSKYEGKNGQPLSSSPGEGATRGDIETLDFALSTPPPPPLWFRTNYSHKANVHMG